MKKPTPEEYQRLGELFREMQMILKKYHVPSVLILELEEGKEIVQLSGTFIDFSYLITILIKHLCQKYRIAKDYFIDTIEKFV